VITVYISIGNSDDNLSQREWADFIHRVRSEISQVAERFHGEWYSAPDQAYQNACWCAVVNDAYAGPLKRELAAARGEFGQDSIAWAVAETEFI
jgi:hypothetical protein